ncbi:MAG: cation diffusion facilitator family transporter [Desulfobacteraceae bacterium]|nr:MAG: cation diffusion facilitator family transporter [Desulfobacteraceae bacterium]
MHDSTGHGSYTESGRSVLVSLITDFLLLIPDLIAAILANSITLWADVIKCMNELVATFLGYVTIRRVAKGKTHDYNYGRGKLENLSGVIVALVMTLSILIVLYETAQRIHEPEELNPVGAWLGVLFMSIGVVANVTLWMKNYRVAQKTHSPVMESQWRLFRAKAFSDAAVLLALAVSIGFRHHEWALYVDPVASFMIVAFLIFSAYGVVSTSLGDLLDRSIDESLQLLIVRALAKHFEEYVNFHGLRSRRSGRDVYIELFLEFDGARIMGDVQRSISDMIATIEQDIPGSHVLICPTKTAC